jgi:uncharacterized protein (TIGR00369 family)
MPTTNATPDGAEIMRQFIPASPLVRELGIELESIADGHAVLRLPYAERITTTADLVHGGAIASLIDVAAMACSWAGAEVPQNLRGSTVSLTIDYVDGARAEDLRAEAQLVRRGRRLCCCDITVRGADERVVAKGLATYQVG